jgi:DNA modification methylase
MLPRTIEELEELQSIDSSLPGLGNILPILQESVEPEKAESELLKDRIISLINKDEEKAASAINAWVAKKENIEIYLGVTLATFFERVYPELKDKSYGVTETGGYLHNISGRQNAALMEAINEKFPKLNVRMLNFSAAEEVAKILKERQVHKDFGNWWIKTGTVLKEDVSWEEQDFEEPGLVSAEEIKHLPEETKFVYRGIDEGDGAWDFPGSLLYRGLVIFAIERKN